MTNHTKAYKSFMKNIIKNICFNLKTLIFLLKCFIILGMNKALNLKIVLIISFMLLFAGVFIFSTTNIVYANTDVETLVNKNTKYDYIYKPTKLSGSSNLFFVTDIDGNLYQYSNNELVETNICIDNIVDICYVQEQNILLVATNSKIYEYNASDFSLNQYSDFTDIVSIDKNSLYSVVASNNSLQITLNEQSITISNYNVAGFGSVNFSNIKDIAIYGNSIYVLDADNNYSRVSLVQIQINSNLSNSTATYLKQVSVNSRNEFEINTSNTGILIREENALRLFDFEGNAISSLLADYTHFERAFASGEVVLCRGVICDGNNIVIADQFSNSIQLFTLQNNALTFNSILVASSGSDLDRLNNATSFCVTNDDELCIADKGNRRIIFVNQVASETQNVYINTSPSLVTLSGTKQIYAYSNSALYIFENTQSNATVVNLGDVNICDMQISSLNELYLIDSTSHKLYFFNENSQLVTIATIDSINANSKLNIDASGNTAYLTAGNSIFSINLKSLSVNSIITTNSELIDFAIDYKNNIYALTKTTDGTLYIEKYQNLALSSSRVLSNKNYVSLEININNGIFYLLDSKLCTIYKANFNAFTENLTEYENDLSFINNETYSQKVIIAEVKNTTYLYKYPFTISPILELEKDRKIIILDESCDANTEFSYCLIADNSNVNMLGYIPKQMLNFNIQDITPSFEKIKIASAYAYIYKLPTSLYFENGKNLQLDTIAHLNDEFEVVGYSSNYTDYNGNKYYTVKLSNNTYAYIKTFNAMNASLDVYQLTFQPNGHLSVIKSSDKIEMFNYVNDEYIGTSTYLENGTDIFVNKDYTTDKEYTKIVYLNDNNEQITTYVLTKYIVVGDITRHIQFGIILFFISLSLITMIAIFIIKIVKQRKMEENLNKIN